METEIKTKGVVFSRVWWAAAMDTMERGDRLNYYDTIFAYAFDNKEPGNVSPVVRTAFAMVKPFIDQDKTKYAERCERNRKNANSKKPVAASGSQSLPVACNTNTNTNTNTNKNTNTISLSPEKEKYFICGMFFARGALKPAEEMSRFWEYYDSLGWKNNKGAEIVKKTSAARMWNLQTGVTAKSLALRGMWFESVRQCATVNNVIFDNVVDFRKDDKTLHIIARDVQQFAELCETKYMAGLHAFATACHCDSVVYDAAPE